MKKNIDGENIAVIIVILVILAVVGITVYQFFISDRNLLNNESMQQEGSTPEYPNNATDNHNKEDEGTSSGQITEEEKNQMNVDTSKITPPTTPPSETPTEEPKEEQIATYTTTIYDKDANRVSNIALANSKLNGKIIKNGESFSFNNTIGPMNEQQGFKKALGFDAKGKKILISGGGLCQISSTLYNAVLIANLNVTERHAHSRRVYYVPKDKDATIAYGTLDFQFVNNSGSDIKILASNDNVHVTITLMKIK